jgi:hypothetical protein
MRCNTPAAPSRTWTFNPPPHDTVRQDRTGYAAKLHRNLCGPQVTWCRDSEATRFTSIHEAFERAHAHGLKDFMFYVEPAPDEEEEGRGQRSEVRGQDAEVVR